MKFSLTVDCTSDAFEPSDGMICNTQLVRILRQVAADLENCDLPTVWIRDINGNTVGSWTLEG